MPLTRIALRRGKDAQYRKAIMDGVPHVALIATRNRTRWGLPKGAVAPGETSEQAALREVLEETGLEAWKAGIHTAEPVTTDGTPDVLARLLEPRWKAFLDGGRRVVGGLGGEHSVTLGPVRAVAAAFPDLVILHVDAHADVRSGFGGTEYGHGCIFRKIVEHAPVVEVPPFREVSPPVKLNPPRGPLDACG